MAIAPSLSVFVYEESLEGVAADSCMMLVLSLWNAKCNNSKFVLLCAQIVKYLH